MFALILGVSLVVTSVSAREEGNGEAVVWSLAELLEEGDKYGASDPMAEYADEADLFEEYTYENPDEPSGI